MPWSCAKQGIAITDSPALGSVESWPYLVKMKGLYLSLTVSRMHGPR